MNLRVAGGGSPPHGGELALEGLNLGLDLLQVRLDHFQDVRRTLRGSDGLTQAGEVVVDGGTLREGHLDFLLCGGLVEGLAVGDALVQIEVGKALQVLLRPCHITQGQPFEVEIQIFRPAILPLCLRQLVQSGVRRIEVPSQLLQIGLEAVELPAVQRFVFELSQEGLFLGGQTGVFPCLQIGESKHVRPLVPCVQIVRFDLDPDSIVFERTLLRFQGRIVQAPAAQNVVQFAGGEGRFLTVQKVFALFGCHWYLLGTCSPVSILLSKQSDPLLIVIYVNRRFFQ